MLSLNGPSAPSVLALLAAACVAGSAAVLAKAAYEAGGDVGTLLAVRFVPVGGLACGVLLWTRGRKASVATSLCLAVGVTLFAAEVCVLFSLERLPAAVTILILFSAPAWIAITERYVWKRSLPRGTPLSIVAVLAGLTVMAWPFGTRLDRFGALLALIAAGFLAVFFVLFEGAIKRGDSTRSVALVLVGAGVAGLLFDPTALSTISDSPDAVPYAVGYAVAMAAWIALMARGLPRVGAVTASVISAVEPVFVASAAFVFLSEGLELRELGGGLLVMAGVLLLAWMTVATSVSQAPEGGASHAD